MSSLVTALIGTIKVELKRDGMIVVGAAVGSDDFVRGHIMGVVLRVTRKLAALSLLDAQNALQ